jgi:adenylosuccinate lyase
MKLNKLTAICPLDGRYRKEVRELEEYFSEQALIKYRLKIEVLYLIKLAEVGVMRQLKLREKKALKSLFENFNLAGAKRVKRIERRIKHDVKAVEYFIKEKLSRTSLKDIKEMVHWGLTSEDINNLAYSLMMTEALKMVYLPDLKKLIKEMKQLVKKHQKVVMLARTHGQPASPTTLGKEINVFVYRLDKQIKLLPQLSGKLNGAVGNYNAHVVGFSKVDWLKFSKDFIKDLGLKPSLVTTQVEGGDSWAELFQLMMRINNILKDFNQDMWLYISQGYLKQKINKKEVGSSTMPHKVNPIDFENSEGNLELAQGILGVLSNQLTVSRLQRDLSSSTISRNIGLGFSYSLLAIRSSLKGVKKIEVDKQVIKEDLEKHPEVITEGIQTILRREGMDVPYEELKKLTRGKRVTLKGIHEFIDKLKVSQKVKNELKQITPENYIGLASH